MPIVANHGTGYGLAFCEPQYFFVSVKAAEPKQVHFLPVFYFENNALRVIDF